VDWEYIPGALAVGARFGLTYENHDGDALPVRPGSYRHVGNGTAVFTVLVDGPAGFLAIDAEGRMYDLVHVRAWPVASIGLGETGPLHLDVGDVRTIEASPMNEEDTVLAGTLDYDWQSTDEGVASVVPAGSDRVVEITATAPGTAQIVVEAGGASTQLEIEVEGEVGDAGAFEGVAP
jgi:hypothetical protein